LKPEAKKTALSNCCLVLPGQVFLSLLGSPFVIRHSSFVILAVASCSFFFSATSHAATTPDGSAYILTASPGLDGIDCITAYDTDEAPMQICEDSSDPWNDLDEISLPSNDKATIPSREDQTTPQFTTTTLDAIAIDQPGIIPAFLFSTQSSFCLCEHLRERAPPSLV
jgi:hypothetical protein